MSYLELAKKIQAGPKPIAKAGPVADPTEGRVIAYLIACEVLGCDIWFALDDSFDGR